MDYKSVLFPVILFLVAFFVWTIPIQHSPLPFGEGDAAWHFGIGDFIASHDKTVNRLPPYVGYWYYLFNPVVGPFALEYPPSNHINYGIMEAFGGDRFVSVYVFKAVASFLGVFAVYFLLSRLYNGVTGFVAGLGLAFSSREIMTYLWGQQPTLISIVIIPVLLYSFFRFVTSLYEDKPLYIYLYMTAALFASQYLLHIQGVLVSVVAISFFSLFMLAKYKRIPKVDFLPVGICLFLLAVVVLPFLMIYFGPESDLAARPGIGRLFSWDIDPSLQQGAYPDSYFFFQSNYGWLLLPFLVGGIIFMLLRRKDQDLLMLGWIAAIYLTLHLDVFLGASIVRVARMLVAEPQVFFAAAAIGAFYIPGMLKVPVVERDVGRLGLSIVLAVMIILTIGIASFSLLSSAYPEQQRISRAQLNAAEWIASSLPDDAVLVDVGTSDKCYVPDKVPCFTGSYPKMRFFQMVSQRPMSDRPAGFHFPGAGIYPALNLTVTHYVFDYSEMSKYSGYQQVKQQMQLIEAFEKKVDGKKLYDNDNIRVYEVENA